MFFDHTPFQTLSDLPLPTHSQLHVFILKLPHQVQFVLSIALGYGATHWNTFYL